MVLFLGILGNSTPRPRADVPAPKDFSGAIAADVDKAVEAVRNQPAERQVMMRNELVRINNTFCTVVSPDPCYRGDRRMPLEEAASLIKANGELLGGNHVPDATMARQACAAEKLQSSLSSLRVFLRAVDTVPCTGHPVNP